jgi:hypothetical protein
MVKLHAAFFALFATQKKIECCMGMSNAPIHDWAPMTLAGRVQPWPKTFCAAFQ